MASVAEPPNPVPTTNVINHDRRAGWCTRCAHDFTQCYSQASCDANLAATIAAAITLNCEAFNRGEIAHAVWSAEQNVLWKRAADVCLAAAVLRIVCPSLTTNPGTPKESLDGNPGH